MVRVTGHKSRDQPKLVAARAVAIFICEEATGLSPEQFKTSKKARRKVGHARLAGQALHLPCAERRRRIELLPASHRSRGRNRHAGDGLESHPRAAASRINWTTGASRE